MKSINSIKKSVTLASLFAGVSLAIGCSFSPSGPGDFGGGDLSKYNVTKEMVQRAVDEENADFPLYIGAFNSLYELDSLSALDQTTQGGVFSAVLTEDLQNAVENMDQNLPSVLEKMYRPQQGKPSALDHIYDLKIEINFDGPCLTESSHPHDGSSSMGQGKICISAPRLSEKLDHMNLKNGVRALIAHEFAHEMGANEDEAKAFELIISQLELPEEITWNIEQMFQEYDQDGNAFWRESDSFALKEIELAFEDIDNATFYTNTDVDQLNDDAYLAKNIG
ncbi:MAG: hypothetical protein R2827_15595 [Bdellovibrionales bacterium]